MKRIDLTITARSPLAIGRQKPGGSVSEVEHYIPGIVVRGAIAGFMLRQAQQSDTDLSQDPESDFKALFMDGKALFLNAYPALAEINDTLQVQPGVQVLPATALSAKNGGGFKPKNGVFDSLIDRFCAEQQGRIYDPNCPQDGDRVDPFKGFYSRSGKQYYSHAVNTRLLTRVGINRRRATAEESILYSIEVLDEFKRHTNKAGTLQVEPMVFLGSIWMQEDDLAETLCDYLQNYCNEFRLGNSASRGLGKVTLKAVKQDVSSTVPARIQNFNQALDNRWKLWKLFGSSQNCPTKERLFFTVDLQSDAILTEQWRRTTVISESMLQSRLQTLLALNGSDARLEGNLQLHAVYSSYDYRSGWNAAWGLMKDVELTTQYGSVYLFSIDRDQQTSWLQALEQLDFWGIGDRTAEGFGHVKVCDEFHCVFREEPA